MESTPLQTRSKPAFFHRTSAISGLSKKIILSVLQLSPTVERRLLPLLRATEFRFKRWLWLRGAGKEYAVPGEKSSGKSLLLIDPGLIETCSEMEFSFQIFQGEVLDGDWDQSSKGFDSLDVYKAFEQVCKLKTAKWTDTVFYKNIVERISRGDTLWNCNSKTLFDKRCDRLSALYEKIKQEGYKSQIDIVTDDGLISPNHQHEVSVAIGRHGKLLFSDGAHRLSIAKLLGVKQIPVTVTVRHANWVKFRNELRHLASSQEQRPFCQPCLHPDLVDIPADHENQNLFDAIRENLPVSSGELLDIGAKLGYFSSKFEDIGFRCISSEGSAPLLYFIEKLREALNKKFEVRSEFILDDTYVLNRAFDVVLALNNFHHFLKTEELYNKLTVFLRNLKAKCIVLGSPLPDEPQMDEAYQNLSPEKFCKFVAQETGLTKSECIYKALDGHLVYLLQK